MPTSDGHGPRCPSCDAVWTEPDARWCGACGASLDAATSPPGDAGAGVAAPAASDTADTAAAASDTAADTAGAVGPTGDPTATVVTATAPRGLRVGTRAVVAAVAALVVAAALLTRGGASDGPPAATGPTPGSDATVEIDRDDVEDAIHEPMCLVDDCLRWSAVFDASAEDLHVDVALGGDLVVVGDGTILRAIEVADGSVRWERPAPELPGSITVDDALFALDDDRELVAVDLTTGADVARDAERRWSLVSDVVALDDGWLVVGTNDSEAGGDARSEVVAFDLAGQERWRAFGQEAAISAEGAVVADGALGDEDATLRALALDGEARWEQPTSAVSGLEQVGPAVLVRGSDDEPDELVRRSDGTPYDTAPIPSTSRTTLTGVRAADAEPDDPPLPDVAAVLVEATDGAGTELCLLEGDEMAWTARADDVACCRLVVDDTTLRSRNADGSVFDRRDGTALEGDEPTAAPGASPRVTEDTFLVDGRRTGALFVDGTPVVALPGRGIGIRQLDDVAVALSDRWLVAVELDAG